MRKKKFLILTLLLAISLKVFSCECAELNSFVKSFVESEFIADITILETYTNTIEKEKYARIKINKLYKGKKISNISFGSSEYVTSCDRKIEKGMHIIVYLNKFNNKYSIGSCNRVIYQNLIKNEKEILELIIERNENYDNRITPENGTFTSFHIENAKEKMKINTRIGVYEIQLNELNEILTVKTLAGFGNLLNKEIISNLKKLKWSKEKKSIGNTKHLVEVYHLMEKSTSKRQEEVFENKFFVN